jgi:N12 class adenine-specific DNA methylase/GGDEF domain-containing protein
MEYDLIPVDDSNKPLSAAGYDLAPVGEDNKPLAAQEYDLTPVDDNNQPVAVPFSAPQNPITTPIKALGDSLSALGASGVDLVKGSAQALAGGLYEALGLPVNLLRGTPEKIGEGYKEITGAFPIPWERVLSPEGMAVKEGFDHVLGLPARAGQGAGEAIFEATGSPLAAALTATGLEAAPILYGGRKGLQYAAKKGAGKVVEAAGKVVPEEMLYKTVKSRNYTKQDLVKVMADDPTANPDLVNLMKTDPTFRSTVADAIRKGEISVEDVHPNWLGEILGKKAKRTVKGQEPSPEPPVEVRGALETGPPAAQAPPGEPISPSGGPMPMSPEIIDSRAVSDYSSALSLRDVWSREGFDVKIGTSPDGKHVVSKYPKGTLPAEAPPPAPPAAPPVPPEIAATQPAAPSAPAPAAVAPNVPPAAPPQAASAPAAAETPQQTVPSPGSPAGAPPPTLSSGPGEPIALNTSLHEAARDAEAHYDRRRAAQEGPRERRADTELRAKVQRLIEAGDAEGVHNLIYIDPITGLKNRRAWEDVDKADARFGTLDLEGMKAVNDAPELGHAVGDILLKNAADALKEAGLDPYRTGGDEFSLLFNPDDEANTLNQIAKAKEIFADKKIVFKAEDGTDIVVKGAKFNFGMGKSEEEADANANEVKRISVERGERAGRGELPGWAREGIEKARRVKEGVAAPAESAGPAGGQKGEVDAPEPAPEIPTAIRKTPEPAAEATRPQEAAGEAESNRGKGPQEVAPPAVVDEILSPDLEYKRFVSELTPEQRKAAEAVVVTKPRNPRGQIEVIKNALKKKGLPVSTVKDVPKAKIVPTREGVNAVPVEEPAEPPVPAAIAKDIDLSRAGQARLPGMGEENLLERDPQEARARLDKIAEHLSLNVVDLKKESEYSSGEKALLRLFNRAAKMGFDPEEIAEAINSKILKMANRSNYDITEKDLYNPEEVKKALVHARLSEAEHKGKILGKRGIIKDKGGADHAPDVEGTVPGEPGNLPAGSSRGDGESGDAGSVPAGSGESGDRDVPAVKKKRPRGTSGSRAGSKRPASEGEGGTGGTAPVEEPVLEDASTAAAEANEEFGITPGKTDYILTPEDVDFTGRGAITRSRDNIAAIKVLQKLEGEGRLATPEEQKILVRYSGWGGLSRAFDWYKGKDDQVSWREIATELEDLLPRDLYLAARDSVLNAHYTSLEVVDAMWSAIRAAGFKGGRVLEPGAGIGNFLMRTPMEIRGKTRFTAIELDPITGTILKNLNQSHDVRIQGYQESALSDNFYDLAISNVPFAEIAILSDPKFTRHKFSLHDYFFAKTLDKVRPGGLIAFITSRYTMDKQDAKIREYIAGKADLLGSVRLPRTAFKSNASTEVVTDIIFLRRRAEGEPAAGAKWMGLKEFRRGENTANTNEYYAEHPQNILGNESFAGGMYSANEYTVEPANENLGEAILHSSKMFIANAYEPRKFSLPPKKGARTEIQIDGIPNLPDNAYTIKDDKVFQRVGDKLVEISSSFSTVKEYEMYIETGKAARELVTRQLDPDYADEQFEADRVALNKLYDKTVKARGPISDPKNKKFFGDDPNYHLLRALEYVDPETKKPRKADILLKRIVQPTRKADVASSPRDAMLISLFETGAVDLARIAELLGTDENKAWEAIQGDAFQTPEGVVEIRDRYLSGNVRKKLREAEAAAAVDPRFSRNAEALKAVIPPDVPPSEIYVNFGASWIAPEYIEDFAEDLLKEPIRVSFLPGSATWVVEREKKSSYRATDNIALLTNTWGTRRVDAIGIITYSLNQQPIKVYDTVYKEGTEKRVVNLQETLAAEQKQKELKARFQKWVWEDPERTEVLHRAYNDNFNSFVEPKHDGTRIYASSGKVQVPGQNTAITLRDTQINAVWRSLVEGNTLLWHEVGTGKTFIMATLAMELRRLGIAQKPMIVVPKVIFSQIQDNFMTLFPGAKILAPEKQDFEPANRQRFLYRIATGDWDAVIVTKEHLQKIPVPQDTERELIQEAIDELERAIAAEQETGNRKSRTLRELLKLLARLKERLAALANIKRDENVLSFDQLGVDYQMVDEAHYFKNLRYTTRTTGVAGLGSPEGNKRSWDLYVKTTYLNKMTKNRGVLLSTGTPISNSIAELYTIQRYLSPDLLKELNIASFDSWAATFGSVETGYEITVEGGYKAKKRFANFNNMPELSRMVRQVADTVTAQMAGVKRPEVERITVDCPASQEYLDYQDSLSERADRVRKREVDKRIDNFPKISTDGRHAAVDIRLRVPTAPDYPDSKVNKLVANVYKEWVEGKGKRLTQLVFLDLGVEKTGGKKKAKAPDEETAGEMTAEAIRTYTDIKQKLLKLGIPASEIALIQDKKYEKDDARLKLYKDVNEGKVRVLIGSTSKMSEGMNVQKRLIALHHMDPTWTPMGIMQREGRILRQGNENENVRIYTYLTSGRNGKASFDAFMWQLLESKATPINELQSNATPQRTVGDVSGIVLNASEWKALATGNPLVVEKVKLQDEYNRLSVLKGQHEDQQRNLPHEVHNIREQVKEDQAGLVSMEKVFAVAESHPDRDTVTLGGKQFDIRGGEGQKERMELLSKALVGIKGKIEGTQEKKLSKIGEYRGFDLFGKHETVLTSKGKQHFVSILLPFPDRAFEGANFNLESKDDGLRFKGAIQRTVDGVKKEAIEKRKEDIRKQVEGADEMEKLIGKPFEGETRLAEVKKKLAEVDAQLGITQEQEESASAGEILLDDEESPDKNGGDDDGGTKLYASPLDPELFRKEFRSIQAAIDELIEARELAKKAKRVDLGWFSRAVNTPYYIFTEKFPQYAPVFERMRSIMQERDDIASVLAEEAVSFFSGLELEEKKAVNRVLIKGRYQRKVYTREDLEKQKLTPKQIAAYQGIRKMLDHALEIYEDAIIYRVTKGRVQASSHLSLDILEDDLLQLGIHEEQAKGILETITKIRNAKRAGYAPFARFGDWAYGYVHVGEDGQPDWRNPTNYFAKAESAWKAAREFQALKKRFHKGIEEGRLIPVPPRQLLKDDQKDLLQDIGGFELEIMQKLMALSPEVGAELKEAVENLFQASGFRRHFFESKDAPGFSTDMERALADYIVGLSGFVSRLKGLPEMDALAKGMEKFPSLARYYKEWRDYSISPHEEFQRIRSMLFLYFLGGNVKSAAINLTQIPTATIPWLTQYVSPIRALEEVTRATKDIMASLGERADGTMGVVIDKLPRDVREVVSKALREGLISEQLVYDLMGVAHKPSHLRKLSKQKQRIVRGFGYMFSAAERFNRLVTLIAAARVHRSLSQREEAAAAGGGAGGQEPPKPPSRGPSFEADPFDFGKRAVDESQFIYAKYNRPRMFRNFGAILGTFRTFVINYMELLSRLWKRSKRAVLAAIGSLWFFSGLKGVPFAENVKYVLEEIWGAFTHQKPDIETEMREWGYDAFGSAEFMDYLIGGPQRHLTGVDIGASVSAGDMIPLLSRDYDQDPLATLVGAPAEVFLKRPARAYGLMREGQVYRAVETVAPEFLRNPMVAARILKEGLLDRQGGKIAENVPAKDAAMKALGFMPTSIAKAYEREEAKTRISERTEQKRKDAYRGIVGAIRIKDTKKAMEILRKDIHGIRPKANPDNIEFTGKRLPKDPADWIVLDEREIERRAGEAKLPAKWRGILRQPTLQRPAFLKMNKLYGGEDL